RQGIQDCILDFLRILVKLVLAIGVERTQQAIPPHMEAVLHQLNIAHRNKIGEDSIHGLNTGFSQITRDLWVSEVLAKLDTRSKEKPDALIYLCEREGVSYLNKLLAKLSHVYDESE